jgi:hypothetical protein
MKRVWPGAILLSLTSQAAMAVTPLPAPGISLGAQLEQFNYREKSDGERLNEEEGPLQGGWLSLAGQLGPVTLGLSAARLKGTVDYTGQTQSGRPLTTETEQGITRFGISLEGPAWQTGQFPISVSPYLTSEYSGWNRSIQPTDISRGLTEKYRWWRLAAGANACLTHRGQWCLRAGLNHTFAGTMTVKLDSIGAGEPELELGGEYGGEIALGWSNGVVSVQAYYQEWSFGASDPQRINAGQVLLQIREPASKTRIAGLAGGLRF